MLCPTRGCDDTDNNINHQRICGKNYGLSAEIAEYHLEYETSSIQIFSNAVKFSVKAVLRKQY